MSKVIELKTWPVFFKLIVDDKKTFEIRKNDRDYEVGCDLLLKEYCPEKKEYTGASIKVKVAHIVRGGTFGIFEDYVVLSIKKLSVVDPCDYPEVNKEMFKGSVRFPFCTNEMLSNKTTAYMYNLQKQILDLEEKEVLTHDLLKEIEYSISMNGFMQCPFCKAIKPYHKSECKIKETLDLSKIKGENNE